MTAMQKGDLLHTVLGGVVDAFSNVMHELPSINTMAGCKASGLNMALAEVAPSNHATFNLASAGPGLASSAPQSSLPALQPVLQNNFA